MSAAFVIESRGREAGLVVQVDNGRFRFFAAISAAAALEGAEFKSPVVASKAVRRAISSADARRDRR